MKSFPGDLLDAFISVVDLWVQSLLRKIFRLVCPYLFFYSACMLIKYLFVYHAKLQRRHVFEMDMFFNVDTNAYHKSLFCMEIMMSNIFSIHNVLPIRNYYINSFYANTLEITVCPCICINSENVLCSLYLCQTLGK